MNDYDRLKHIIESTIKSIRYKTIEKGWLEIPILCISEDSAPIHKKPSGKFFYSESRLPYAQDKKKTLGHIFIYTFDPKQENNLATPDIKFIILTHEYGHFLSWENKMKPLGYEEARTIFNLGKKFRNRLSEAEKAMIIEEEQRAWNEGIKFVKSNNFELSSSFYSRKKYMLSTYHKALR
jgi:hypothetical protein